MKSTQLLSVVFSLIMFTGITAGNAAFADSGELDDLLEDFCEMTDEEKRQFFADHPRLAQFDDRLANYCELSEDEREDAIDDFIEEHIPEARNHDDYNLDDKLERYCEMTDEEKEDFVSMHEKAEEYVTKMNAYCELDEDEQDAYIEEHKDEYRMHHDKDMRDKLEQYCEMSDQDKRDFLAEHDKAEDHAEKMNSYCELDKDGRMNFIEEHRDEYKDHMKDKMMDKLKEKRHHLDYDRLCTLSQSDRALEIDDSEKLDRLSNWCDMTPEEREDYKKEHHDQVKDKMHDSMDKVHEMKMSDMSPRLKEMIMNKHDISDERMDEIKMKFQENHGALTDERKSELKMKFTEHMSSIKANIADERKSDIHDRLAEMKAFKAELRERSSEMTEEEKQELRAEFIEKAKDLQLAWISPRIQVNAGVDAGDVECREGFSLVMKASNGAPLCLKADTALKMIERGLAVPAN